MVVPLCALRTNSIAITKRNMPNAEPAKPALDVICHDFARKHVSIVSQFHSMEILQAGRTDASAAVAVAVAFAAALLLWQLIRKLIQ